MKKETAMSNTNTQTELIKKLNKDKETEQKMKIVSKYCAKKLFGN
jgi:hypothetical protein